LLSRTIASPEFPVKIVAESNKIKWLLDKARIISFPIYGQETDEFPVRAIFFTDFFRAEVLPPKKLPKCPLHYGICFAII
jgi:hypothetical protein